MNHTTKIAAGMAALTTMMITSTALACAVGVWYESKVQSGLEQLPDCLTMEATQESADSTYVRLKSSCAYLKLEQVNCQDCKDAKTYELSTVEQTKLDTQGKWSITYPLSNGKSTEFRWVVGKEDAPNVTDAFMDEANLPQGTITQSWTSQSAGCPMGEEEGFGCSSTQSPSPAMPTLVLLVLGGLWMRRRQMS